ncbi:molybdate ABC transporter substrate-binding protein [Nesterenkonia sp. Act20]|uniref:molybdate ABC transporter substrate-binding protein n=1 Tax=Nesterenkonia sp. Act20 TaxID=1483432 RepID=UPI001C45A692|nr:molybdate ABC transporter substrate-binding protein [Nesterenkonia sp. Act20]
MRTSAGLLAAALLVLPGCAPAPNAADGQDADDQHTAAQITVFAAASLDEVMTTVADDYTAASGVDVEISSAGSAGLLAQLQQGAPADVFIPADEQTMERAASAELITPPTRRIAANTLVIAVPAGNPAQIRSLQDLDTSPAADSPESSPALVVCAEQVPCGAAAQQAADAAGVTLSPVSEELAVTDVLGKVSSAEADAGLVYSTDVLRAGDQLDSVEIEGAEAYPNHYPAAVLQGSAQPAAARDFIEFLLSAPGQRALREAGFSPGDPG